MKKVLDFLKKNIIQVSAVAVAIVVIVAGIVTTKVITYKGNSDTIDTYTSDKVEIEPEEPTGKTEDSDAKTDQASTSNTLSSLNDKEVTAEQIDKSAKEALDSVVQNIQQNSAGTPNSKQQAESSTTNSDKKSDSNNNSDTKNTGTKKDNSKYKTCTLSITCYPFLDDCSEAIKAELPSGGGILTTAEVEYQEGDTVYDVLERACRAKGIPYTAKQTMYGTYVSSLDNLSERYYDNSTGWMYFVDGADPGVSSSQLEVTEGMHIVWSYDAWSF